MARQLKAYAASLVFTRYGHEYVQSFAGQFKRKSRARSMAILAYAQVINI